MQTITLNNGVHMPMLGLGVFQAAPEAMSLSEWHSGRLLLVNDTKGKREEIKLKVTAGEAIPEIKRTWE